MDRYGASSRHYSSDSDYGCDYSPRSGPPPRDFGYSRQTLRGRPTHGRRTVYPDPYTSDDESNLEPRGAVSHHTHHRGHLGGAGGCAGPYGSHDENEFEPRASHHHGRGHGHGMSRNGPPGVGIRRALPLESDPRFCGGDCQSGDDEDSEVEHRATTISGRRTGLVSGRRPHPLDSGNETTNFGHRLSRDVNGPYGPAGRRSMAPPARGRPRAPHDFSDDESEFEHYVSSRRGHGRGMMAPPPRRGSRNDFDDDLFDGLRRGRRGGFCAGRRAGF